MRPKKGHSNSAHQKNVEKRGKGKGGGDHRSVAHSTAYYRVSTAKKWIAALRAVAE